VIIGKDDKERLAFVVNTDGLRSGGPEIGAASLPMQAHYPQQLKDCYAIRILVEMGRLGPTNVVICAYYSLAAPQNRNFIFNKICKVKFVIFSYF